MQGTTMKARGRTGSAFGFVAALCCAVGSVSLGAYLALAGPTRPSAVKAVHASSAVSRATPAAVSPRACPIEAVRVGYRMLAGNPEGTADEPDVDPVTWRQLTLVLHKRGILVDITLLRPLSWIAARGAAVGGTIELDLAELDIVGPARVLAIDPCPPLDEGEGRVVTGTFAHDDGGVLDLRLEGLARPIGVTVNHPVYSEDRRAFVRAEDLKAGESLRGLAGPVRVASLAPRPGTHRVYNLEIHGEHVYRVSELGLLVHNTYSSGGNPFGIVNPKYRASVAGAFRGTPKAVTLTDDLIVYRRYGGISAHTGSPWFSLKPYASAGNARRHLALPNGNSAENLARFRIPAGTTVLQGQAGSMTKVPGFGPYAVGGGSQIYLPNPGIAIPLP